MGRIGDHPADGIRRNRAAGGAGGTRRRNPGFYGRAAGEYGYAEHIGRPTAHIINCDERAGRYLRLLPG